MNIPLLAADISKWISWGQVTLQSIHGYNNQATKLYIQFHQVPPKADGTLTVATVPALKSLEVLPNAPFFFDLPFTLSECLYVVSSTELNYTAVAAAGGLDATLVCVGDFLCDGTEVVVGDLTTAVNTLQVWSEASGLTTPKRLLRFTAVDSSGNVTGLAVQALDALQTSVPGGMLFALAANTTRQLSFGYDGISPYVQTAAFVSKRGCTIRVVKSTTPPYFDSPLAQPAVAATAIRAIYKP